MTASEWSGLIEAAASLLWLLLAVALLVINRDHFRTVLQVAVNRVQQGSGFSVGVITIGEAVGQLQVPTADGVVTDDNLALVHRSWRVPERDEEFGSPMYQIHVIVFGPPEAMERVEYVIYRLENSYPQPVKQGGPLKTNFELKELANGYSLLRADVHVRGQSDPVRLSRFLDLTDQSPRLKGTYQNMVSRK